MDIKRAVMMAEVAGGRKRERERERERFLKLINLITHCVRQAGWLAGWLVGWLVEEGETSESKATYMNISILQAKEDN